MNNKIRWLLIVVVMVVSCSEPKSPSLAYNTSEQYVSIFNGKDLKGWVVPKDNIWWTVEGGILRCQSGPDKKGRNLWTEKHYKNFLIEFDFKMGDGTVDSGVYIRSSKQQIQIGYSGALKRDMTASLYVPRYGYASQAKNVKTILDPKQWNTMKIKVLGSRYIVWLNNQLVLDHTSNLAIKQGPIGFQLLGQITMSIDFKDIKLAEL